MSNPTRPHDNSGSAGIAAIASIASSITPTADAGLAAQLQARLDQLTKPIGALGRLEALALQVGLIQRSAQPTLVAPAMLLFAADHGIAVDGVSAYPREVTAQMVANIVGGGAAISVLCRQHRIALTVTDVGVLPGNGNGNGGSAEAHADTDTDTDAIADITPRLLRLPVTAGTADMRFGPAMSAAECARALAIGRERVVEAAAAADAILLGEMGIGNSSSAALLTAWTGAASIEHCTGRGTGLDDGGLARKRRILAGVLERHRGIEDPLVALAAMGGLEIAAMVGAILEAAARRRLVVIDGFIATAALLIAWRLAPAVLDHVVVSHRSSENGHRPALALLGITPLLDLDLRLGEGSGAALAWPLIRSSLLLLDGMATFASAGVSTRGTAP